MAGMTAAASACATFSTAGTAGLSAAGGVTGRGAVLENAALGPAKAGKWAAAAGGATFLVAAAGPDGTAGVCGEGDADLASGAGCRAVTAAARPPGNGARRPVRKAVRADGCTGDTVRAGGGASLSSAAGRPAVGCTPAVRTAACGGVAAAGAGSCAVDTISPKRAVTWMLPSAANSPSTRTLPPVCSPAKECDRTRINASPPSLQATATLAPSGSMAISRPQSLTSEKLLEADKAVSTKGARMLQQGAGSGNRVLTSMMAPWCFLPSTAGASARTSALASSSRFRLSSAALDPWAGRPP